MRVYKAFLFRLCFAILVFVVFFCFDSNRDVGSTIQVVESRYQLILKRLDALRESQKSVPRKGTITGYFRPVKSPTKCMTYAPEINAMIISTCMRSPNQQITWEYTKDGEYADHFRIDYQGKCLDAGLVRPENDYKPIMLYGCHGGNTQRYSYDRTAKVIYRVDDTRCFDYTTAVDSNDTRVASKGCDLRDENQKWNLEVISETFH